jgi:lipopolysaccharide export system protein LptC
MMQRVTAFALVLAAAFAALVWMQERAARRDESVAAPKSPFDAPYDYYVSGLRSERFDGDGELRSRLEAARVTHYPDGDRAELQAPRYTAFGRDGGVWQVGADTGTLAPDAQRGEDRLDLLGAVELRKPLASGGALQIRTTALAVFTGAEETVTDAPVSVRTPDTTLAGTGLQALLAEERIRLLHEVRGSHDPTPDTTPLP